MHLRLVLTVFEGISGLHVNWRKSILVTINAVPNSPILAGILGCEVGNLPTKYLGLSLGSKNKAADIWEGVLDKCEKKLTRWKSQYLSLGGRIILVSSVLDSLPTYIMSLFPIPAKVRRRIDQLRRNFIWEGNRESKGSHLVNWNTLISSKRVGGLGIRNLSLHNKSLLMK